MKERREKQFFATASGIGRESFLDAYGNVAKISQLMIAPLGVGSQATAASVLGEEKAEEEYMKLFRKWEEVVSRSVYSNKEIPEDRVAASMHLFLEVQKDHLVMECIRREATNVTAMISPPSIVPMIDVVNLSTSEIEALQNLRKKYGVAGNKHREVPEKDAWILGEVEASTSELNLNTPAITVYLIRRVLMALKTLFDGIDHTSLPSSWENKYRVDLRCRDAPVRENAFSPHDIPLLRLKRKEVGEESSDKNATSSGKFGMPAASIDAIISSLKLLCPDGSTISVTMQQYFALLDIHGKTTEVEDALKLFFKISAEPEELGTDMNLCTLDVIRIGAREHLLADPFTSGDLTASLAFSAAYSPLTSYLTQISCTVDREDGNEDEEDEEQNLSRNIRVVVASRKLLQAQAKASKSTSSVEVESLLSRALKSASKVLTTGLSKGNDDDDEEGDEEDGEIDEDAEEIILHSLQGHVPDQLLALVLSDWAASIISNYTNMLIEAMTYGSPLLPHESEDSANSPSCRRAMRLVNLAVKMRPFDGRGYEVRATILSQLGQREAEEYEMKQLYGDSEEEEDEGRGGSDHLQAAAKDALAAFHLGGSSDLSLAGNAEDACRQASRLAAKMHYKDKMNKIRLGFSSPSSLPDGDAYDGGEDETKSAEESMPRQWLVQAYLCGYEPPSLALSVPVLPYIEGQELFSCDYLSLQESIHGPYKQCQRSAGVETVPDMIDIDFDDNRDSTTDALPMPPLVFLESPLEVSDDGGAERVPVGRQLDRIAFHLLRHLTTLLEAAVLTGLPQQKASNEGDYLPGGHSGMARFAPESTSQDDSSDPVLVALTRTDDSTIEISNRDNEEGAAAFVNGLQSAEAKLVAHGVCVVDSSEETHRSERHEDWFGDSSSPEMEQEEEQELEEKKEGEEKKSFACRHFMEAARVLKLAESKRLTGVSFHSSANFVQGVAKSTGEVSEPIRARLLNLCSVVAYLLGDAEGAVSCLRASLEAVPLIKEGETLETETRDGLDPAGLIDSAIKLGALLCDMDERKEAAEVLASALTAAERASLMPSTAKDVKGDSEAGEGYIYPPAGEDLRRRIPRRGQTGFLGCQTVAMLHLAELAIHRMDLDEAQSMLHKAGRLVARVSREGLEDALVDSQVWARFTSQLETNVTSLLGVVLFRKSPDEPDGALGLLKRACKQAPDSLYLHLSYGEVLSQAGDLVGSLACFHQAHDTDPTHPLPFVNAARTYQQLNQLTTARLHLDKALLLDPHFSLTYIDVAQAALQAGKTEESLRILDRALLLARHVSDLLDVLTAKRVAELQLCLEQEGLYYPPGVA